MSPDARAQPDPSVPRPPRLLDRMRAALRVRHDSPRTERSYVGWVVRFILFHGKRHPREAGSDIRTAQELRGHADVSTTMIDTHVLNRGGQGVRSPLVVV